FRALRARVFPLSREHRAGRRAVLHQPGRTLVQRGAGPLLGPGRGGPPPHCAHQPAVFAAPGSW
nr:hypothetical protein [Tanacetum cinerariifolium]